MTKATAKGKMAAGKQGQPGGMWLRAGEAAPVVDGTVVRTRLKKAGGSLMVTVPARVRDALRLVAGQEMEIAIAGQSMVVEAVRQRPTYRLDELLAKCDPAAPIAAETLDWMGAPPVGRETW